MDVVFDYLTQHSWESLGALSGFISIYLNTKENPLGWPMGILSVLCYLYVFWEVFLFGDVLLHVVYLLMGLYGWYQWLYGKRNTSGRALHVAHMPQRRLWVMGASGAIGTLGMGYLFAAYTPNTMPYADAFTTAFSLVGQYMLARKYIENWLLWMVINIACVVIYAIKGLHITTVLYALYFVLAIVGYGRWRENLQPST